MRSVGSHSMSGRKEGKDGHSQIGVSGPVKISLLNVLYHNYAL